MDDAAALHGDQEGEHREDGQLDKAGEVTIIQSISLTFNGSKPVVIPNQFVVQDITVGGLLKKGSKCQRTCSKYQHHMFYFDPTMQDLNGRNFLKLQASSAFVSRLVCSCVSKNASLANGTKVQELKKKRNEKLQSSVGDEDMKNKKVKRRLWSSKWVQQMLKSCAQAKGQTVLICKFACCQSNWQQFLAI